MEEKCNLTFKGKDNHPKLKTAPKKYMTSSGSHVTVKNWFSFQRFCLYFLFSKNRRKKVLKDNIFAGCRCCCCRCRCCCCRLVSLQIYCTVTCRSGQTKFNLNVNKLNFDGCCCCCCCCCWCCSHETVYI